MKKNRFSKGIQILPSLCTTVNLFLGFFSIIRSLNNNFVVAAWAILGASVFDLIDGRVARMTRTQSDFGKEYDSLVDLASFGMSPAILAYTWYLHQFHKIGWFVAFVYFACAALRLARFNVQSNIIEKKSFNGLPTPPSANFVATFVLFHHEIYGSGPTSSLIPILVMPLLAILMVSRVSYQSFKEYHAGRDNFFIILIGAAFVIGLIAVSPEVVLFIGFSGYVVSGPLGSLIKRLKNRNRLESETSPSKSKGKLSVVELKSVNHE